MSPTTMINEHEPVGIIVTPGQEAAAPATIWAYLWVEDEGEDAADHWHHHLPVD
ncbi:MAG TPA: hypothetical protein VFS07_03275 [Gemmatimonadales bacterium]|jgi:hypothetical protein|nr:hypothetical protein [Gemmatimonadales bacterium]